MRIPEKDRRFSGRTDNCETKSQKKIDKEFRHEVEAGFAGSESSEVCREAPKGIGVGFSRVIRLFSGIYLCISNCRYFQSFGSKNR